MEEENGSYGGSWLRLEEGRIQIRLCLQGAKPDDVTPEAGETVKKWNYCPSHVILAFFSLSFLKPFAAAAAEPWATGLSPLHA